MTQKLFRMHVEWYKLFISFSIGEVDELAPVTIFELLKMKKELELIDARIC